MVKTDSFDDRCQTHTLGPPPRLPEPPDGPDDGDAHDNGGKPNRLPLNNAHLGMLIFIGAETMFFAGLISTGLVLRQVSQAWLPPAFSQLSALISGIGNLFLLTSALTIWQAQRAMRRWEQWRSIRLLLSTALLGGAFLACQGYEWVQLGHAGLTLASGAYGAVFYTLIGCHGLHVCGAIVWVLVVTLRAYQENAGITGRVGLSLCSMYWYFIVVLWPVLYRLVYFF